MLGMIGAFFARSALNTLRRNLDPRASSGGIFLGLNGIVVKAHGGTDAIGFAGAADMAIDMVRADINARISTDRGAIAPTLEQAALT
jgi:glycerol-3-phosphate acyltransferase PlsX